MAKALGVWLLSIAFFCCTNLSLARQLPKECSKGPIYWCENLKQGADCGAVGHCIGTVWEMQKYDVRSNPISDKFVKLFRQLKDVKDLINEDYLMNRVASECHDVHVLSVARMCKDNVADLQKYLYHVLTSETSPEALCHIIGMCNNDKLDNALALDKSKAEQPKKNVDRKAHLVGANPCTWGPAYWCGNFSTTHECSAVSHCVRAEWQKKVPVDSDPVCNVCTEMVNVLRKHLQSDETQIEVRDDIERYCKMMPVKAVAEECVRLADQYAPELVAALASDMDPHQICTVAGLCNSARIDSLLEEHEKEMKEKETKPKLLGSKKCTYGPSYWCNDLSTGHECGATKYCAVSVWPKKEVAEDNDSICKICLDMVQQARDQLESNETQEELKEVFDGSCKLIPIKLIAKECMKLADDFVPELVETLSSEMNPQQVCSVAGLCNSQRIDNMLDGYNTQLARVVSCNNCKHVTLVARQKFDQTTYEDFLVKLLQVCRNMDSFSDSCSMLVFKYYESLLAAVKHDLTPQSVCQLSGQCTRRFHAHDLYTFPEPAQPSENELCEFCEQVVKHMRDVLVANTTEMEFDKVLKGLCKQTGGFKDECLQLAEQYFHEIYDYLSKMRPGQVCEVMQLCAGARGRGVPSLPLAPLLPPDLMVHPAPQLIGADEAASYKTGRVPTPAKQTNVRVIKEDSIPPPLPVERMFVSLPQNNAVCSFCQYFLHYLQVQLSDSTNEDEIKEAVDKACDVLPQSVKGECQTFVDQYAPAVIALLVQEIDPSSVCPALKLCPQVSEVRLVTINAGKSNCPLCLFAVEQLEAMLENNRTEESVRHALDNLCNHLSTKLRSQCVDFVDQYTRQLVEMLVADMNAQEICVFLKLCKNEVADPLKITTPAIDKFHSKPQLMGDRNNFRRKSLLPAHMLVQTGDIETNEIPDDTVNGRVQKTGPSPKTVCVICEFVMREIDDQIKDKHNDDEIKKAVLGVCKMMPKSVRSSCDEFVSKYADMVISLLAQELDPSEVCAELKLCPPAAPQQLQLHAAREEILDCAVCETVVMAVKKVLSNDKVDRNIVHIVEKSCALLPAKYSARCHTMMEIYGDSVIHLIEELGTKGVCKKIGLCSTSNTAYVRMHRGRN